MVPRSANLPLASAAPFAMTFTGTVGSARIGFLVSSLYAFQNLVVMMPAPPRLKNMATHPKLPLSSVPHVGSLAAVKACSGADVPSGVVSCGKPGHRPLTHGPSAPRAQR